MPGLCCRPIPLAVAGIAEPLKLRGGCGVGLGRPEESSIAEKGRATFVDVFQTDDDAEYTASDRVHRRTSSGGAMVARARVA